MIIDEKIRDEKLQYDISREAAKTSPLSSEKIDKYEYLTGGETFPFNHRRIIEQSKFANSTLRNAFEKQTEKQADAIKSLDPYNNLKQIENVFPQNLINDLICTKLKEIVELQNVIKKDDLNYKSKCGKIYTFSKYLLPIVFLRDIQSDIQSDLISALCKYIFSAI